MSTTTPLFGYYPLRVNATTIRFQFVFRGYDIALTTMSSNVGIVKSFVLQANSQYGGYKTSYTVRNGIISDTRYKSVTCMYIQPIEHDLFNDMAYLEYLLGACIDKCAADLRRS